jgi:hypothetical protein
MIHYHGLPMTPAGDMLKVMAGRHAMVSFEHPEQIEMAAEVCQSIVLDNGAFSAWVNGREYDFGGFREWVEKWRRHPAVDWFVIPDVIDGSESENDALLSSYADDSMAVPVYHMHESIERFRRLCLYFPRVAIGSSGTYKDPGSDSWWARMSEMMDAICDVQGRPLTKLHGLRMLDPVIFSHLPLASADSCNVARNIGIDSRWNGNYAPRSKSVRAMILIDRIESHASAATWNRESAGVQHNLELLG